MRAKPVLAGPQAQTAVVALNLVSFCPQKPLPNHEPQTPNPPAPKISLFFPLSCHNSFHSFLSLLLVLSLNFGGATLKCARLDSLCRVMPLRVRGRQGRHTTVRELQTYTFEGPVLQKNTTKVQREDPSRERRKCEISGGKEKQKRAKFWAVGGAVQRGGGPGD